MVFVEMDRCATDAIQSVTGCSLGKRTMKFMDYGKMAATFMNLSTRKAFLPDHLIDFFPSDTDLGSVIYDLHHI